MKLPTNTENLVLKIPYGIRLPGAYIFRNLGKIFNFGAPQLISALMRVKLGGRLLHAKFNPIGATFLPCRAKNRSWSNRNTEIHIRLAQLPVKCHHATLITRSVWISISINWHNTAAVISRFTASSRGNKMQQHRNTQYIISTVYIQVGA